MRGAGPLGTAPLRYTGSDSESCVSAHHNHSWRGRYSGGFRSSCLEVPIARSSDPQLRRRWQQLLDAFDPDRFTVAAFCRKHGVSVAALYQRRRKLQQPSPAHALASRPTGFLPIEVQQPAPPITTGWSAFTCWAAAALTRLLVHQGLSRVSTRRVGAGAKPRLAASCKGSASGSTDRASVCGECRCW